MTTFRKLSVDLVFRMVIVVSLIGSLLVYINQRDLSNCVASWANRYTISVQARSVANTDRIDSLNRLIVDIISAPNSEATSGDLNTLLTAFASGDNDSVKLAAQKYLDDIKANNSNPKILSDTQNFLKSENDYTRAVAEHPIPDPPKEVC